MGVQRERWRWLAPLAAFAAVVTVVSLGRALLSRPVGPAALPEMSATTVLSRLLQPTDDSWSALVDTQVDLGLPGGLVPALGGGAKGSTGAGADASTDGVPFAATPAGVLSAVLTADSKVRVWTDGPRRLRAQILQPLGEVDVVHDGQAWWTYSAADDAALRITGMTAPTARTDSGLGALLGVASGLDFSDLTPQGLATALLRAAAPSSEIRLVAPQVVDGRPAYTLRILPRSTQTLLARVDVAVDGETGLALRVQVSARGGGDPVLDTQVTDLDLARPSTSRFVYSPAEGTSVGEWSLGAGGLPRASAGSSEADASPDVSASSTLPAWDTVVRLDADASGKPQLAWHGVSWHRLSTLGQAVPGGRVLHCRLGGLLVTEDGRAYAGFVPDSVLLAHAASEAASSAENEIAQEWAPPPGDDRP